MELIVFSAEWCGPCKKLKPILSNLVDKLNIKTTYADIEDDIVEHYSIRSIPTIVIIKNGIAQEKITGLLPSEVLESKLKSYM